MSKLTRPQISMDFREGALVSPVRPVRPPSLGLYARKSTCEAFPATPRSFEQLPIGPKAAAPRVRARSRPTQPASPTFEPVPVRWRGLTMDAAKWTFSSAQLHNIVARAIKHSAESSSVRLLPLDVLDQDLPVEVERLEHLRDVLQTRYKAQVRRRRLLMRSLALYIDGHDPPTSRRLLDDLDDVGAVCDQLAEDLYLVGDQLAQIAHLRDVHHTSALAVALRKINQSYIRARAEVVDLETQVSVGYQLFIYLFVQRDVLAAERDEAWLMAESLERELEAGPSRVEAARRSSVRQSKMIRKSLRRSMRSSTSSMRYHSIVFPRPPDTLLAPEPSRPESVCVLPPSPTTPSHDLFVAQSELLNMLGLSYTEYGFKIRPRSYSDSPAPSPRKLVRCLSDQALRRRSNRLVAVQVPDDVSWLSHASPLTRCSPPPSSPPSPSPKTNSIPH